MKEETPIEYPQGDVMPHVCIYSDVIYISNPPQKKCSVCGKFVFITK